MVNRKRPLRNAVQLKTFGAKVKKIRLDKGMSQEEVAIEAGIERSYMGAIERGERNPSYDKILSIAKAIRVKPSELL
jgi:transcriptional regulator with XRE-family HTH domain